MAENELSQDEINDLLGSITDEASTSGQDETGSPDVLPQSEIDDLLGKIAEGEDESGADFTEEEEPPDPSMMIKIYDFYRPDIFPASGIRRLHEMLERMASAFCSATASFTGQKTTADIVSIDSLTLEELMRSQPNPSVIIPFALSPQDKGGIFFTTRAALMLTRLFMGLPADGGDKKDMEHPVMLRMFRELTGLTLPGPMTEHVVPIRLEGVHTSPESGIFGDPMEMILTVAMNFHLPDLNMTDLVPLAFPSAFMLSILGDTPARSGEKPEGGDLLLSSRLQFSRVLDEEQLTGAFGSNMDIPVDPRVTGSMKYEKRREVK